MDLQIRHFQAADHARAFALWETTAGVGLSDADAYDDVRRFLERNPNLSFVALDGETMVGTILCGHDGRRGLIHHLAVAETHRRRGLGRTLVSRGLASLREVGIHKCHLFVYRDNAEGRSFWQRMGAEERVTLTAFSLLTAR